MKIEYRGLIAEVTDDLRSYEVYEITPIFKNKSMVICGSSADGRYSLDYIKSEIDKAFVELEEMEEK